ncbi:MAG: hypothetical protein M1820_010550 [Bogoriella megaspora]|nr:MAG: hypothetical protein M1820_010550 [Bogoriella megaspora]
MRKTPRKSMVAANFGLEKLTCMACVDEIYPWDDEPFVYPLSTSTKSESSLQFIKECLNECFACHESCDSPGDLPRSLPKRLLRISPSEGKNVPNVSLEEDVLTNDPYLILSHCWGGYQPHRLLRHNLDSMLEKVDVESLSPTFKDAIWLTMELGYRYLWIDCFCILQDEDDDSDWQQESAKMMDYYLNAVLTIAATDSLDGEGGLFRTRNSEILEPCIIQWNSAEAGPFTLRRLISNNGAAAFNALQKAHLNRRAWVLQERLLSRRVLHFSHAQIWFECREATASEARPCGVNVTNVVSTLSESSRKRSWYELVRSYSQCELSRSTDRLIAFAGIVERFAKLCGLRPDDYVAGFWRFEFPGCLYWVCDRQETSSLKKYIAPSWSWASVSSPIEASTVHANEWVPNEISTKYVELLETHVALKASPFGSVSDAFIRVKAHIFQIRPGIRLTDSFSCKHRPHYYHQVSFDYQQDEQDFSDRPNSLWHLPLLYQVSSGPVLKGLLLRWIPSAGKGVYERVGNFSIHGDIDGEDNVFPTLLRQPTMSKSDRSYLIFTKLYRIRTRISTLGHIMRSLSGDTKLNEPYDPLDRDLHVRTCYCGQFQRRPWAKVPTDERLYEECDKERKKFVIKII